MRYLSVSNPRWADAQQSSIECTVVFDAVGEVPFCANPMDSYAHGREIFSRAAAGDFGPVAAYLPPPAPSHEQMVAATLKKARALRPPIMSILDGMQASALTNGTNIMVNQQPVPLSDMIENCKQALKDLPQQVDLSQCTTQQQMEAVVLQAYLAIVAAAPPEIKSAFDSLKP